ncbi:hypothetical protein [Chitinibacter sp. S2-10]|uniref:hypothetical protein n=1 Tax=Chitinibacter sp. S2-10 TaxID=3373597 RepID=UPI003977503D
MKKLFGIILICAGLATGNNVYARQNPMLQPERVLFVADAKQALSKERVGAMIVQAANRFNWTVIGNDPGKITLKYDKGNGKHMVKISVDYDDKGFQIKYVDSFNMNYESNDGNPEIHPNYNRWIANLSKEISNLQFAVQP